MKALFSFWSRPFFDRPRYTPSGNWIDNHLVCWALSINKIKRLKQFDEIILHTDSLGYDILVNQLKLPFDRVELTYDNNAQLQEQPLVYWAYAKLLALELEDGPVIHFDHDHFQQQPLNLGFECLALCPHPWFPGAMFYKDYLKILCAHGFELEQYEMKDFRAFNRAQSSCCGVIGFTDDEAKFDYIYHAKRLARRMLPYIKHLAEGEPMNGSNCVYEQWMVNLRSKQYGYQMSYLSRGIEMQYQKEAGYFHPYGTLKHTPKVHEMLVQWLKRMFPDTYAHYSDLVIR